MKTRYSSMDPVLGVNRRRFLRGVGSGVVIVGGAALGVAPAFSEEEKKEQNEEKKAAPPDKVKTNIDQFMKVPKAPGAVPGPFPGRVVKVTDERSLVDETIDAAVVAEMFAAGLASLTGKGPKESFGMLLATDDVVGLKVNPVGPPLIHTKLELVEAVIRWLVDNGMARKNIVIWDRFDAMLSDAGYNAANFPGVRIEALQTMDEEGDSWRTKDGHHVSEGNFDRDAYYRAEGIFGKGVRGYKDDEFYLNQHVFAGEDSYFGKLVTKTLTKIINLPVVKNTGNGVSVATKNLGYGALCNVGRLHAPLFFTVCTEVVAAPWIRDKLVLNIADGLRAQYEGGPMPNAQFVWPHKSLYFATDPFALDMVCHRTLLAKRKAKGITVNEHPRYTEYLHYAEKLGLGVVNDEKLDLVELALPVAEKKA